MVYCYDWSSLKMLGWFVIADKVKDGMGLVLGKKIKAQDEHKNGQHNPER